MFSTAALQVSVRAEAKRIGQRAIKRAAAERTAEDNAAAQRAALASALSGQPPVVTAQMQSLVCGSSNYMDSHAGCM